MFKAFRETGKGKQIMKECLELCFTEMSLLGRKCVGNVPVPRSLPPITLCGWDGWLEDRLEASPFLDLLGLNTFQMSLLSPVRWVCGFQVRLWRNSVKYLDHILIAPKSRARSHIREVWPQSLPSGELPGMGSPDGSQSIHRNFISLVFTLDMVLLPLKKKIIYFWPCWVFVAMHGLFSSCGKWGPLSRCSEQASHCSGFSCCSAWVLGHTGFSSCAMRAQ